MNLRDLKNIVRQALDALVARDAILLTNNGSEWSIAHRLGVYLEHALPGWNIDCEYNRQGEGDDPKCNPNGTRVRPDIVIHHRGRLEREHNLLAIELKKSGSAPDLEKAREYTAPPSGARPFQYRYGLSVALADVFALEWFENGVNIS
jgi:hypothetical protein